MPSESTSAQLPVHLLGLYLLGLTVYTVYLLLMFWPELSAAAASDGTSMPWRRGVEFWWLGTRSGEISAEVRLLTIVIFCGVVGSQIHALKSFSNYTGSRMFGAHWVWWYLLRAPSGALLALVFYFAMRGGLLLLSNGHGAGDFHVFGVAGIATMAGLFSEQAIHKLKELFDTMFTAKRAPNLPDALPQKGEDSR